MLEFDFEMLTPGNHKAHFSAMTKGEIYDFLSFEGHLVLRDDLQIFFSEDIAAAELYWYLCEWYNTDGIQHKRAFTYDTIEYYTPILTFSYHQGRQWIIDSPWRKAPAPIMVEESILDAKVRDLLSRLAKYLEG